MRATLWFVALMASVLAANWMTATFGLVSIGFGLSVAAGTFAAGFALVARDGIQISTERQGVVVVAIMAGAVTSWWLATPALALASALAFGGSELADWTVFSRLQHRSIPLAVIASSLISAPIDTVLFLHLAGFGVTWEALLGQLIVKTTIALLFAGLLKLRNGRALSVNE